MPGSPTPRPATRSRPLVAALVAIVVAYLAHGAVMIFGSSFLIDGERLFCLFDDAMISLTYARNLAEGQGLAWNPGETPVEGYTNFLWVVLLAPLHWLGLSDSGTCLAGQVLGLLSGAACVAGAARLAGAWGAAAFGVVAGTALVALSYSLKFLAVMGMETPLAVALVTFALAGVLRTLDDGRVRVTPFVLLALATLVRMDLVLCLGSASLVLFARRREHRLRLAALAGLALVPILAHTLWRFGYYGQWLPNTYYAKMTGWPLEDRLARGLHELVKSLLRYGPVLFVSAVGLILRPRPAGALILGTFGLLMAYSVWVGGDVWPLDRFLLPMLPALLVDAAGHLDALARWLSADGRWRATRWPIALAGVIVLGAVMEGRRAPDALLFRPVYCREENRLNVARALAIRRVTETEASVGMYYAGAVPYFSRRRAIDFLGKSDPVVAHEPIRMTWREGRALPGHNKWSWPYSIGERRPDVITRADGQGLSGSADFQEHYRKYRPAGATDETITFWLRTASPHVRWDAVERAAD